MIHPDVVNNGSRTWMVKNGLILIGLSFLISPLGLFAGTEDLLPIPAPEEQGVVAPLFCWPTIDGAKTYRLFLGWDPNDILYIDDIEAPTDWYYYVWGFYPAETYYWRVDAILADNTVITGSQWQFTTLDLIAEDPSPENGSQNISTQAVLRWVPGLTAYEQDVFLGTDAQRVAEADTGYPEYQKTLWGEDRLFEPSLLEPNTTYYWRIDSVELDGWIHQGSVWSFHTWPIIHNQDPNLIVWWPFDEGQGDVALDYSGYGHHGDLSLTTWAKGREGHCLRFEEPFSGVQAPGDFLPVGNSPFTLMAWLQPHSSKSGQTILYWGIDRPGMANILTLNDMTIEHSFGEDRLFVELNGLQQEWVHVAVMHTGGGHRRIAINGTPQNAELVGTPTPQVMRSPIQVGRRPWPNDGNGFLGMMDDVRIYDYSLSETEIRNLIRGDLQRAGNPSPRDRSLVDVETVNPLTWESGEETIFHDVYFGDNQRAVADANYLHSDVYQGEFETSAFTIDDSLFLGKTYYWRIDENQEDGTVIRGDVWQFTVAEYLVVDDFESYTGRIYQRIYETWIDGIGYEEPEPAQPGNGTGATVGHWDAPHIEEVQVYAGSQSLPLYYNNTDNPGFSQADRFFETSQDWTRRGIRQLTLYVSGLADNTVTATDLFYVLIRDVKGNSAQWTFSTDAVDLKNEQWQLISIPVASMQEKGLATKVIRQLSLGVGKPEAPLLGGQGIVFVDEIYLGIQ